MIILLSINHLYFNIIKDMVFKVAIIKVFYILFGISFILFVIFSLTDFL